MRCTRQKHPSSNVTTEYFSRDGRKSVRNKKKKTGWSFTGGTNKAQVFPSICRGLRFQEAAEPDTPHESYSTKSKWALFPQELTDALPLHGVYAKSVGFLSWQQKWNTKQDTATRERRTWKMKWWAVGGGEEQIWKLLRNVVKLSTMCWVFLAGQQIETAEDLEKEDSRFISRFHLMSYANRICDLIHHIWHVDSVLCVFNCTKF